METVKYLFFGIGTLAFFANVYLAIKNPDSIESANKQAKPSSTEDSEPALGDPLRNWDQKITLVMWGGWGCAALTGYLIKVGMFGVPD